MEEELKKLDAEQMELVTQLEQRLTDIGEKVIYKRLYEISQIKISIYKQQLKQI